MLTVLLLHACVCYTKNCPKQWAIADPARHVGFDVLLALIQFFNMEVFFLLAGFFFYLVYERIGPAALIKNRIQRIVVPLILGYLLIIPLIRAVWVYGAVRSSSTDQQQSYSAALKNYFAEQGWNIFEHPAHLWFLEYLVVLYVAFTLIFTVAQRISAAGVGQTMDRMVGWMMGSPFKPLLLSLPTALLMSALPGFMVPLPRSVIPELPIVVYYGFFFLCGVLLYRRRSDLAALSKWCLIYLCLALFILFPVTLGMLRRAQDAVGPPSLLVGLVQRYIAAVLAWLLVLGFTGLFLAMCTKPSARMRYSSDSSYWLYLVHLPLVVLLNIELVRFSMPAIVKYALVLIISVPLLLLSYQYCVRYTMIGRMLNGPRARSVSSQQSAGSG